MFYFSFKDCLVILLGNKNFEKAKLTPFNLIMTNISYKKYQIAPQVKLVGFFLAGTI
jgi:hypothetical protein